MLKKRYIGLSLLAAVGVAMSVYADEPDQDAIQPSTDQSSSTESYSSDPNDSDPLHVQIQPDPSEQVEIRVQHEGADPAATEMDEEENEIIQHAQDQYEEEQALLHPNSTDPHSVLRAQVEKDKQQYQLDKDAGKNTEAENDLIRLRTDEKELHRQETQEYNNSHELHEYKPPREDPVEHKNKPKPKPKPKPKIQQPHDTRPDSDWYNNSN